MTINPMATTATIASPDAIPCEKRVALTAPGERGTRGAAVLNEEEDDWSGLVLCSFIFSDAVRELCDLLLCELCELCELLLCKLCKLCELSELCELCKLCELCELCELCGLCGLCGRVLFVPELCEDCVLFLRLSEALLMVLVRMCEDFGAPRPTVRSSTFVIAAAFFVADAEDTLSATIKKATRMVARKNK
mmetsp:Transcript_21307/g.45702  ORF Transcript_21307/g.45702 Transcript_21307/m.45702 type:complete len:192 (-) Transcript_21307:2-577(-)